MAVLRVSNGGDIRVRLSVTEAVEALDGGGSDAFMEFSGEDGPIHVKPSAVIAVIGDTRRGTAGFHVGSAAAGE